MVIAHECRNMHDGHPFAFMHHVGRRKERRPAPAIVFRLLLDWGFHESDQVVDEDTCNGVVAGADEDKTRMCGELEHRAVHEAGRIDDRCGALVEPRM